MPGVYAIPKRFPARAGDRLMGTASFHDGVIRVVLTLEGQTDAALLARALRLLLDAQPVAGCRIVLPSGGLRQPYFQRLPDLDAFPLLEVMPLDDAAALPAALERWALLPLDPREGPLLRAALFRPAGCGDTLCLRLSHALGDGGGTMDLLYQLAELYAALERDPAYRPKPNLRGDRSYWQVIRRLSLRELRQALQTRFPQPSANQWSLARPPAGEGPAILVTRKLAPGRLAAIRAYAKAHGASVNDVLLAGWYRAIYRLAQPPAGARLAVMTHLNQRRRLPERRAGGIANLSQVVPTSIGSELGTALADTVARVHAEMERVKDTPPMLGMLLPLALLTPDQLHRQMQRRRAQGDRPRFGPGVPMFNNVGQLDPARLRLGAPASNAYLTACLSRQGDTSLQVVVTSCGPHVNLAVVTRDITTNRELLAALLDAFEDELAATG